MDRLCEICRKEFDEKLHLNRLLESAVKRNHLVCADLYITAVTNMITSAGADVNISTGADVKISTGVDVNINTGVDVNINTGADRNISTGAD